MGRHSAPGDDRDLAEVDVAQTARLDLAPRRGRHAAEAEESELAEQQTQLIAVVQAELADEAHDTRSTDELPLVAPPPSKREARKLRRAARGESDTQADLRLLRQRPAVRAQCLAALVVSFGLYTLALFVLGRIADYLFWIWIPIVVTGVLVGLVLDLAHRRERRRQAAGPSQPT